MPFIYRDKFAYHNLRTTRKRNRFSAINNRQQSLDAILLMGIKKKEVVITSSHHQ
jgi:hypothetical protein